MCPAVRTPPHNPAAVTTLNCQLLTHIFTEMVNIFSYVMKLKYEVMKRRRSFFISRGNKYITQEFSPNVCTSVRNILQNLLSPEILCN